MNSKVIVEGDVATNSVVEVSKNNPEFGYIKFSQKRTTINANGFLENKRLYFLLKGTVDQLKDLNYSVGQELPGIIWIEESLTPFRSEDQDLKIAGDTGIVCTLNGEPIYRRMRYSGNPNTEDKCIQHDNGEELRAAFNAKKTTGVKPNQQFDVI